MTHEYDVSKSFRDYTEWTETQRRVKTFMLWDFRGAAVLTLIPKSP